MPDTRRFGDNRSIQQDDHTLSVVGSIESVTYTLDQVTERGATFRMSWQTRYGSRPPKVFWTLVTSRHPEMRAFNTRKAARFEIEV